MPREPRSDRRATRLCLPALTPTEALQLLALLERLTTALWHTHGAAIADRHAALGHETPRPPGARWVGRRGLLPPGDTW